MNKYRFLSIRTLIGLALVIALTTVASGYITDQVYKFDKEHAEALRQAERAAQVKKVSVYYMKQNPRLWEHLALYVAEATVAASEEYQVPLKLLVGKDSKESEANPFAKSYKGAKRLLSNRLQGS